MISAEAMVGDDEQYATLMALMLHSQGIAARVVVGAYREGTAGSLDFMGADMHAWVEVEFPGVGWATFDPTPPRDQKPASEVNRPKSVPKPQVLQPPEPPEQPVELPPASRDEAADPRDPGGSHIPWMMIGAVSASLLVLLGPALMILALKARRRSVRRRSDAAKAVRGSWEELVDTVIDSGVVVQPHLTRQELAWVLSTQWVTPHAGACSGERGTPGDGVDRAGDEASARMVADGRVPGWSLFSGTVPRVVALARRADVADFAAVGTRQEDVDEAWSDVRALRSEWASSVSWFARVRCALSVKSLRWRRRARRLATSGQRRSLLSRVTRRWRRKR